MSAERPELLRGVDLAALTTAFAFRLRQAGISVGITAMASFVDGLALFPVHRSADIYWIARITLVQRQDDIDTFDAVFAAVFDSGALALDPHARRTPPAPTADPAKRHAPVPAHDGRSESGQDLPWATLPGIVGLATDDQSSTIRMPERQPSRLLATDDRPFELLDPAELASLCTAVAAARRQWPRRRSRRTTAQRGGHRIGLRQTVARARRTGFEPVQLVGVRPVLRPRRVVMLCDVSQSMQQYSAAYIHLMWAAAGDGDAEVFAFATSLTRLTTTLRHVPPDQAVERATAAVSDRFGGTRIATAIRSLLSSRHGEACRGAIVLVASDGWDSDPPEALAGAMARLRRRAYKVVWLNPRMAAPGFAPLVGALAAALPHCDAAFAADTPGALGAAMATITRWR
jgi:uncharacterized protein with von Willebrand factor type A (vWA) domain